jgi:ATP-dependent Zn protease
MATRADDPVRESEQGMAQQGMQAEQSVASALGGGLLDGRSSDVGVSREERRLRRLRTLALVLGIPTAFLWYRLLIGEPINLLQLPPMPQDPILWVLPVVLILAIGAMLAMPLMSGRSPHVVFQPEQLEVGLSDVKGIDPIVDEVTKTLNTFLAHAMFRDRLGGRPRRGLLFEGPPGTGKTHLAKALAHDAGVPFLFVSGTSFQSMWYGASARKIRSFFKKLRETARKEGGAIGFIEEIDAIAMTRGGLSSMTPWAPPGVASSCAHSAAGSVVSQPAAPLQSEALAPAAPSLSGLIRNRMASSEGAGGVVNELLVQMQSFDEPPAGDKLHNWFVGKLNAYLPAHRQLMKRKAPYHNVLLIAATNRADGLDSALLRPGRFDRRLTFEPPAKAGRRELIDYFLERKVHDKELDREETREALAGQTFGYTPVMIEHLFDEALVMGLKHGRDGLSWPDVQEARLTGELGMSNPVPYTVHERRVVATHEAGHATVAYLCGTRRLEILSIVKRAGSLGLLAHGDLDEVYQRSRKEMFDLVEIAFGGMCAEEVFFSESGTGPGGDLAYATQVACEIVGSCGMAGSLVSLAATQNSAFNDTNLVGRVLADPVTRPAVDRHLTQSKARVRALIEANTHLVEALRDALLERDELIGNEIVEVLEAAGPAVITGLQIDRRADNDRRRTDWLADEVEQPA